MIKNAEFFAHKHLQEMLVEFLRAISVHDQSNRSWKVDHAFWKAISALEYLPSDKRCAVSEHAFSEAITRARERDVSGPLERAASSVVNAAGKVLAERIADSATQYRLAESRHYERLEYWRDLSLEIRQKRGF
jgi:hypothetical protein